MQNLIHSIAPLKTFNGSNLSLDEIMLHTRTVLKIMNKIQQSGLDNVKILCAMSEYDIHTVMIVLTITRCSEFVNECVKFYNEFNQDPEKEDTLNRIINRISSEHAVSILSRHYIDLGMSLKDSPELYYAE